MTEKDIEEKIREVYGDDIDSHFARLLTPEEVANLRHKLGNFVVGGLGDKIYKLPGGGYTGEGGMKLLHEAMLKTFKEK